MDEENSEEKQFLRNDKYCPECGEVIAPADLEMYPRCPYCNHLFPDGPQLEDFVLRPVLQRWVVHSIQQFPR